MRARTRDGVCAPAGHTDSPGSIFPALGMSAQRAGWDARSSWHTGRSGQRACVELCKDTGDKCHAQVAARRSAGGTGAPIRRWDYPAAAPCLQDRVRRALVAPSLLFSPVSPSAARAAAKPRGGGSSFLELRLPRRHPRRFPATSGTRTISSQPGPCSRRGVPEAAAGTAGLDLTALRSWKEPS